MVQKSTDITTLTIQYDNVRLNTYFSRISAFQNFCRQILSTQKLQRWLVGLEFTRENNQNKRFDITTALNILPIQYGNTRIYHFISKSLGFS